MSHYRNNRICISYCCYIMYACTAKIDITKFIGYSTVKDTCTIINYHVQYLTLDAQRRFGNIK